MVIEGDNVFLISSFCNLSFFFCVSSQEELHYELFESWFDLVK